MQSDKRKSESFVPRWVLRRELGKRSEAACPAPFAQEGATRPDWTCAVLVASGQSRYHFSAPTVIAANDFGSRIRENLDFWMLRPKSHDFGYARKPAFYGFQNT